MENPTSSNAHSDEHLDKPTAAGNHSGAAGTPAGGSPSVSRTPLNLGAAGGSPATPNLTPPSPAPAPSAAPRPAPAPLRRSVSAAPAVGRTTGCKTFFTKLHPGAIEFLDEQIATWLKDNPSIVIRHTNVTVGEVQAKKTEPNILITVWY